MAVGFRHGAQCCRGMGRQEGGRMREMKAERRAKVRRKERRGAKWKSGRKGSSARATKRVTVRARRGRGAGRHIDLLAGDSSLHTLSPPSPLPPPVPTRPQHKSRRHNTALDTQRPAWGLGTPDAHVETARIIQHSLWKTKEEDGGVLGTPDRLRSAISRRGSRGARPNMLTKRDDESVNVLYIRTRR